MKMRGFFVLVAILSLVAASSGQTRFRSGIFLHHSTGGRIWGPNDAGVSVPTEIAKYNLSHNLLGSDSVKMVEALWPSDDNEWSTWHDIFSNRDTNDIRPFLASYPVIMIKSCFPSSQMTGVGSSADTLQPTIKSIANYKWHWRSLISAMKERPQNFFVIWTNAPLVAGVTKAPETTLSDAFCRWAKDTLAAGFDPVIGAFPRNVFVFDFFHLLAGPDGMLPQQLASGPEDSHPNGDATTLVTPQLVKQALDAALAYESATPTSIPNSLAFGKVVSGHSVPLSFQVVNSSTNTLRIDSAYTQTNSFGASVNTHLAYPGETILVTVSFLPNGYGDFIDTLSIRSNSQSALLKVPLSGSCPAPDLAVSTTELTFVKKAIGDSASLSTYLKNNSINAMTVLSITTLSNTGTFSGVSGSTTVAGADSTLLTVRFAPTSFGRFTDTLKIGTDGGSVKIAVNGISPIPTFTSLKPSLAFGDVVRYSTKNDTIGLVNASINLLTIDSIYSSSSEFTVDRISGTVGTDTLKVVVSFTPVVASTYADAIYFRNNSSTPLVKIPLSGNGIVTGINEVLTEVPVIFSLAQNYPNPFNPSTTIRYGLPTRSHVTLSVFNALGQLVGLLQNGEQEAAYHEVRFDGTNLSSGVYIYRIQAGGFVQTRKLLLVR